jgi:uncharacterized protein YkwD
VAALLSACALEGGQLEDRELGEPEESLRASTTATLENGVAVTGLAGAKGSELAFTLAVPAGATNLVIAISGPGTGDADLYVKKGTPATRTSWDFRPYLDGNDEKVSVAAPAADTWNVMLRGYSAYTGVALKATFVAPVPPPDPEEPPTEPPPTPTGPDCTVAASWPADWVAWEDEVLALTNVARAAGQTCGGVVKPPVGPMVMDAALRQAARCHSFDMGKQGYFSHTSLDGKSPWDRIALAGYTASPTGENIAAGYADPKAVVDGWIKSSGHCNNIMNGNSNELGVGYANVPGSPYTKYWTQTMGRR